MTGPSLIGVGAALALVLGVMALGVWLVRRFMPGAVLRPGDTGRIEVLARAALAPRQGVATLRVEGRTALVSYGDGGVHLLMDMTPGEAPKASEGVEEGDPDEGRDAAGEPQDGAPLPPFARALGRAARKVPALKALVMGLALLAATGLPGRASAQSATSGSAGPTVQQPATPRAPQVKAPQTPTVPAPHLPEVSVSMGSGKDGLHLSGPVGTVLFVGFLTLLPTLLLLMTSFTRILVVLHLLKQALGTQTAPPAHLLTAMALILTGFIMAPTLNQVNQRALKPWMDGKLDGAGVIEQAKVPFRDFMLRQTRQADLARFIEMSDQAAPASPDQIPMMTLTAAFVTSELTKAFQMGFALFLPFVIIDLVVASVLMSMGMFMLPPVMVSLPFKLLLFVLVNGWALVIGSLVRSFH